MEIRSSGHEQFVLSNFMKPILIVQRALADYQLGKMTIRRIARKHHVSKESVMGWAKKAHLPPRRRGQTKSSQPTPRQKQILQLIRIYKYEAVGTRFGVTKQEICRIAKRWGRLRKDEINRAVNHTEPKFDDTSSKDLPSPCATPPVLATDFAPSSHRQHSQS
jgi:transposase